jgi:hypothetical protein
LLILWPTQSKADGPVPAGSAQQVVSARKKPFKEYLFGSHPLGWADADWEAYLYYSNVSLNIPFTGKPLQYIHDAGELEIYSKLFLDSIIPRFMLLEALLLLHIR